MACRDAGREAGFFNRDGEPPPGLPANIELHIGWFERTVPAFAAIQAAKAAPGAVGALGFVHVDCDLYSSTMEVLGGLQAKGLLGPGTVVVFDEWSGYPGAAEHEPKAWAEHAATHLLAWEWIELPGGPEPASRALKLL